MRPVIKVDDWLEEAQTGKGQEEEADAAPSAE
jgi:hypothetical protein